MLVIYVTYPHEILHYLHCIWITCTSAWITHIAAVRGGLRCGAIWAVLLCTFDCPESALFLMAAVCHGVVDISTVSGYLQGCITGCICCLTP
jgi:hypothetical protein